MKKIKARSTENNDTRTKELKNWTTEELLQSSECCLEGMEEVCEDVEIDMEKIFYKDSPRYTDWANFLRNQPASARVYVTDLTTKQKHNYFICDVMPPTGNGLGSRKNNFASYLSYKGRMASYEPGDRFDSYEILEVEKLYPKRTERGVDSINTTFKAKKRKVVTITSLMNYVSENKSLDSSWIDEIDTESVQVHEGIIRQPITKFGLQRKILAKEQDQLIRLPIDSKIVLLGAPGTGKTTTLVQRLRNKLFEIQNKESFPNSEILKTVEFLQDQGMPVNWLIFTPSEILKQYVRNALDGEGEGNLLSQMKTWEEFSFRLARQELGLLKTNKVSGAFVLSTNDANEYLLPTVNHIEFFEAFFDFHHQLMIQYVEKHARILSASSDKAIAKFGNSLLSLTKKGATSFLSILSEISGTKVLLEKTRKLVSEEINETLRNIAKECNRKIPNLKEAWTDFLKQEKLQEKSPALEGDEEDEDAGDVVDMVSTKVSAGPQLRMTLRNYCSSIAEKRSFKPNIAVRIQFLENGLPEHDEAEALGRKILENRSIDRMIKLFDQYIRKFISAHYKSFVRNDLSREKPLWFNPNKVTKNICSTELDVLLLAFFKCVNSLYDLEPTRRRYKAELFQIFKHYYKMMVFVDEATDFSPLQIACMNAMCNPYLRSFFASGDFNQRMKTNGIRRIEDFDWAVPGANVYELSYTYRQTKKLCELSKKIQELDGFEYTTRAQTDENVLDNGVAPVLVENTQSFKLAAKWVSERISEMLQNENGDLPTIAIFLPSKNEVTTFAELLSTENAIIEENLRVESCPEGKMVASEVKVGVYPIEFVKGLEFEAVFFVNIDQIEEETFNKYLYVGSTRAARYLGISSEKELPNSMSQLKGLFQSNW